MILDADLAVLYGVSTKRLNEQVSRNKARFPADFMFRLTKNEYRDLDVSRVDFDLYLAENQSDETDRSQIATGSTKHRARAFLPYAFSEHGALMAATVLNSAKAVQMSLFVIRAFVKMREQIATRSDWETRILQIENVLLSQDDQMRELYERIRPLLLPPPEPEKKEIGFHVWEAPASYRARSRSPKKNLKKAKTASPRGGR